VKHAREPIGLPSIMHSVKAEYMYLGLGQNFDTSATFPAIPADGTGFSTTHLSGIHTAKIGLNYKWDWFAMFR
jgi:outer membrane immunogenic protein